jgi:hypothetical protein
MIGDELYRKKLPLKKPLPTCNGEEEKRPI